MCSLKRAGWSQTTEVHCICTMHCVQCTLEKQCQPCYDECQRPLRYSFLSQSVTSQWHKHSDHLIQTAELITNIEMITDIWYIFKGLKPGLEGIFVTMYQGARKTGSQIPGTIGRGHSTKWSLALHTCTLCCRSIAIFCLPSHDGDSRPRTSHSHSCH